MDTHIADNSTTTNTLPPPLDQSPTTSHPNCDLCLYPPWKNTTIPGILIKGTEYDSVAASASHGCPGCTLFQHAFDFVIRRDGPEILQSRLVCRVGNSGGYLLLEIFVDRGPVRFDVFTVEGELNVPNIRVARMLPEKTGLQESLGVAKRWLRSCEERHDLCGQESGYIPMRLLEVCVGEGESGETVRLVVTDEWGGSAAPPRYACLSHCWGTKKPNRITKRKTLANNMRGIPFEELPRTFRDAVSVTRALGINYLWIDSLCIVQDDERDWAAHVEVMANVYQNAYVTLAAGASEDGDGGFFRVADKIYMDPKSIKVAVDGLDSEKATIYLRPHLPHVDERGGYDRTPLETRGWAFQERLLSRRFLCFGAHEVQWECHEETACSCSTTKDGFNNRRNNGTPGFPFCLATKYELVRLNTMDREAISTLWREIVEQYSKRKLTYAKDKLPALAGLAKIFAAATQDEYAYGNWLGTMKEDIGWRAISWEGRRPLNAPSWSWISAADKYHIYWLFKQPLHSTVQVHGLQEERLELSGRIAPVLLRPFDKKNGALSSHYYVLQRKSQKPIYQKDSGGEMNRAYFFPDYKFWDDAEDFNEILTEVHLLDMGTIDEHYVPFIEPKGNLGWAVGLILRKQTRTADDTLCAYERIGFLYFDTEHTGTWKPEGEYLRIQIV